MVVGDPKPLPEIVKMLEPFERILVVACRGCVTVCNVGGEKEAGILATALGISRKMAGREPLIQTAAAGLQCEPGDLGPLAPMVEAADAVVSLACGAGPQFLNERFPGAMVFPGVNTTFIGGATEHGVWAERCQSCGSCITHHFGGLCPITRCAKGLMNGPCGGSARGRCEINKDLDCVWQLIVDKMTLMGRLEELERIWPIKNWLSARDGGPRARVRQKIEAPL